MATGTNPDIRKYLDALLTVNPYKLELAVDTIAHCLNAGSSVLTAGNGGSYSIAQHFAADLRGPIIKDGKQFRDDENRRVVHLGSNLAEFTALINDKGYHKALTFLARRHGLKPGDVVVAFSVSGSSANITDLIANTLGFEAQLILLTASVGQELPSYVLGIATDQRGNDWYGVVEGAFSCIAHEIASRVKERLD